MTCLYNRPRFCLLEISLVLFLCLTTTVRAQGKQRIYNPIPLEYQSEMYDRLSDQDIPTGEGGFAKDYWVKLEKGDQVAVDLMSDEFDSVVLLLGADGTTIAENDDGPDGSTNSLLFSRITESGRYIIRVHAFGETGGGNFRLKVTRLRPINY